MKKIINIFSVLFTIALILAACKKDFLDTEPEEYLATEVAISSLKDAQVAVTGIYDALQDANYYGRNFVVTPEIAADNAKIYRSSGRFVAQYNWSVVPTNADFTDLWNAAYDGISRANNVLARIDNITDGTQEERDQVKGEALFLRALQHFDMVRTFAQPYNLTDPSIAEGANGTGGHIGVPYVFEPVISEPARDLVSEVYANIVSDLTDAIDLMTIDPASPIFVSKEAAQALLARVYLYMEDWTNARDMATAIIDSGAYTLVSNADYIASWATESTTETIFTLAANSVDYNSTDALGYIYLENGYGDLVPTEDILDLYSPDDVRGTIEIVPEGGTIQDNGMYTDQGGVIFLAKYPGRDGIDGVDNYPILRLSEMYLIRAEANANIAGGDALAQADLDVIRQRANPAAIATTSTGNTLKEDIYKERRLELAFEGHRLYDLIRWKKSIVRKDHSLLDGTTPYPNQLFAFPIPQREMDANDNMVQNPAYE